MALATPFIYVFDAIRKKVGDKVGISGLLLSSSVVWLVAGVTSDSLILGGIFLCGIAVARNLSKVWVAAIINEKIRSQERATVLSTLTFIGNTPYLCAIIFLSLAGKPYIKTVATSIAIVMLVGLASYLRSQLRDK